MSGAEGWRYDSVMRRALRGFFPVLISGSRSIGTWGGKGAGLQHLIKTGKAYVCDLSAEEVRAYRGTLTEPGKNSPYRERPVIENLDLFQRMRAG